jgi:hypothetical protein
MRRIGYGGKRSMHQQNRDKAEAGGENGAASLSVGPQIIQRS